MAAAPAGWVTVLLRLPLFYNPEATQGRVPVEDEKFLETAGELAQQFGGGTLFMFRHDAPRGFWVGSGDHRSRRPGLVGAGRARYRSCPRVAPCLRAGRALPAVPAESDLL